MNNAVSSREYKIMLSPGTFRGDEDQALAHAEQFWIDFGTCASTAGAGTVGNLNKVDKRRRIHFLDTKEKLLNSRGYVFRDRENLKNGKRKYTLKFRHPDRYVSQDRFLGEKDVKFEEDIKPIFPDGKFLFYSLYSLSASQGSDDSIDPRSLRQILDIYPDLSETFTDEEGDLPLQTVNDVTVRELVILDDDNEPLLQLSDGVTAETALVLWYLEAPENSVDETQPAVAEFSFRHVRTGDDFSGAAARQAYRVFETLANNMMDWVNRSEANPVTKTRFVFEFDR